MKATDIFSYAFGSIKTRKLRFSLTTLGVIIGITAIVALLSITQGFQAAIITQLQRGFATNTLIVSPRADSEFSLLVKDTETISKIENVTMALAIIQRIGYIKVDSQTRRVIIVGVDFSKYSEVYSTFTAETGAIPLDPEEDMIVIGRRVSDPWMNGTILCSVNDVVTVIWTNTTARPFRDESYTARVVAVLKEIGGFGLGGPSDSNVYIPITKAQKFFGTDNCDMIIVQLKNSDKTTIDSVSREIRKTFGNQVSVTSSTAILNTLSGAFSTIELFLGGIAAISLLVAGIGIMNIMIVSLMERTREIGILKALGMKNRTVLMVFLTESAIIGLFGAVIGIFSGWSVANIVAIALRGGGMGFGGQINNMAITPVLTPQVVMLALFFGIGVSIVFGLYPAWRASRLKPVEALRYE